MQKKTALVLAILTAAILFISCGNKSNEQLKVISGKQYLYTFTDGSTAKATYYHLSDNTLNFVKLTLENDEVYTLPQLVSASGVRYSTEQNIEFWVKGNEATISTVNEKGEWVILKTGITKD